MFELRTGLAEMQQIRDDLLQEEDVKGAARQDL